MKGCVQCPNVLKLFHLAAQAHCKMILSLNGCPQPPALISIMFALENPFAPSRAKKAAIPLRSCAKSEKSKLCATIL
jgi:hypothetical protein